MMPATSMYELLVHDPNDVLAALAFTAYKQHEKQVMDQIELDSGAPPSKTDIDAFHYASSAPAMPAMYRQRAQTLMNKFLEESLKSRKQALEVEFTTTKISQQLQMILETQNIRRSWKGWAAEVSGNLAVNFITILVIAGLLFGFRGMDQLLNTFGQQTGLLSGGTSPAPARKPPKSTNTPDARPTYPPGT